MNGNPGNKDFKVGGWGAHGVLVTCSAAVPDQQHGSVTSSRAVMQPMKEALDLTDAQAGSLQTRVLPGHDGFSRCRYPISSIAGAGGRRSP